MVSSRKDFKAPTSLAASPSATLSSCKTWRSVESETASGEPSGNASTNLSVKDTKWSSGSFSISMLAAPRLLPQALSAEVMARVTTDIWAAANRSWLCSPRKSAEWHWVQPLRTISAKSVMLLSAMRACTSLLSNSDRAESGMQAPTSRHSVMDTRSASTEASSPLQDPSTTARRTTVSTWRSNKFILLILLVAAGSTLAKTNSLLFCVSRAFGARDN